MKATITGATIAVGDWVYLPPPGRVGAKLMKVTGVEHVSGNQVEVTGYIAYKENEPFTVTVFTFQPVRMEV